MATLEELISNHIHTHWREPGCSVCGENDWTMNGPFGLVPVTVDSRGYVNGHRDNNASSPVVAMVCRRCGHTRLIDYNVVVGKEP